MREGAAGTWSRAVDTFVASPDDICEPGAEARLAGLHYGVGPRSIVVQVG